MTLKNYPKKNFTLDNEVKRNVNVLPIQILFSRSSENLI